MEQHSAENPADAPKQEGYSMVQAPVLGLTADESFPVFVPIRFTPMWIHNNTKLRNSGNDRAYDTSDKDRHLSSRAYNPTPYYKTKQPFTAVTVQKSPSTSTVPPETPVKRRRVIKEAIVTGRKFKTATPYRRPSFEETTVKKKCQDVEESKPNNLPVQEIAAPVKEIAEIAAPVKDIAAPVKEIAVPVKEIATPVKEIAVPKKEIAAPVKEIAAPVQEIAAPVKEIAVPVKEIAVLVKEIAAPVKEIAVPVKEIAVPVKEFPKTRTRHIAAMWPNTGMVLQSEPTREERPAKHVSPRFPVPFRKVTGYTDQVSSESPKGPASEYSKGPVKEVSIQKPQLVTYPAINTPNLPTDIQLNQCNEAGQVEKYYKHVLKILEEMRIELEKRKANMDGSDNNDRQKATVKTEIGTEKGESCTANSTCTNESIENCSSTEESANEEILSEANNEISVRSVNRYQEWKQLLSRIPMNALPWLLWFLKRYLFLTFIMIRIFQ